MFALLLLSEEGPNTELAWLLWVTLGFFALMVVIGWLASRNQKPAEPTVQAHAHEEHAHEEHAHAPKREDDLKIIEGIGPRVADVLKRAGIVSFADLAQADTAKVQAALKSAGLNMMDPAGWIAQAKLAAKGDMEGLKKMQAELKGGRLK